jgi:hypothetical protein
MVEQMEREGIVTPADAARPRELRIRPVDREVEAVGGTSRSKLKCSKMTF